MKPIGFVLVDNTQSIYVYGGDATQQVKVGNKVELAASKTYWILSDEQNNAQKFGYKGCNQLEDATIISNDGKTDNAFDKSWITESTVKDMLDTYYETKDVREHLDDERTEEADKVSARITEILSEQSFSFTPDYLLRIHRRLFEGIYKHAGQLRDVNITKKEWVLNGDTVLYSNYDMLRETLEYDFEQEKKTDYSVLNADMAVKQICKFVSGIWQIHPFREGN
ncbi:MAG: Fic family protein, partial [Clostridia bacterium]|nr:Fic family protein [Clostridia bacterium]